MYSSELDNNSIYYDYTYNIISTHCKGIYFLRSSVGFRPYIGAGLGYLRARRDKSIVKIYSTTSPSSLISYDFSQATFSSMHSLYELGTQFIASEKSKLFFNVGTTFYINHGEDQALKTSTFSIDLALGMSF